MWVLWLFVSLAVSQVVFEVTNVGADAYRITPPFGAAVGNNINITGCLVPSSSSSCDTFCAMQFTETWTQHSTSTLWDILLQSKLWTARSSQMAFQVDHPALKPPCLPLS